MRKTLCCLLCCLGLVSCAYYGDMHSLSRPLDAASLSAQHHYAPPHRALARAQWWARFHDPMLDQLIQTALLDSPTIQTAKARIRQAQYMTQQTVASLWPSVGFNTYLQRQRFSQFGLIPPPFNGETFNIGMAGLNFNYEFDFWGKNRQAVSAQVSETCAADAELAEARLLLSAAIVQVYFQEQASAAQMKIANRKWQLNLQLLRIARQRAKSGIYSAVPVNTVQAKAQAAKLSYEQYHRQALLARHQLAILIGKNPFNTHIQTQRFVFHPYSVSLPAKLPASLLANRPDIFAAKARVQAAASRINVAKARFFPNINLSLLFSYQSVELGHLFEPASQNNAITGAIDLPIFDAGVRRANLGVKYAEYDLAVNSYNETILSALREVADQISTLHTLNAELEAQHTALHATRRYYNLYQSRYNQGIADYVPVLESRQRLLEQKAIQLDLQTRQLQTIAAVLKALGGTDLLSQG